MFSVKLPQSCDGTYELALQGYFVFPGGDPGPYCSSIGNTVSLKVSSAPDAPSEVGANVVRNTRLDAVWKTPANVGGCSTWLYTINITNKDTGKLAMTTTMPKGTESLLLTSVTFNPVQLYELSISTSAATGTSSTVVLPFSGAVGQVCVDNETDYESSFIDTISYGSVCNVSARCRGATAGFLPQITYFCNDQGYEASFWYWRLDVISPATTAMYLMNQPGMPWLIGNTTSSFEYFAALDVGSAPQPTYIINASSFDPHIAPVIDFDMGWLPCKPDYAQAAVTPGSPLAPWTTTLTWHMPYALGPCHFLTISIFSEDVLGNLHLLQTVPGCQLFAFQPLVRQCTPYLLHLQFNFLFPNGTVGPACLDQYDPLKAFVHSAPLPPANADVNVLDSSSLYVSWDSPLDLGGCTEFEYDLSVVDMYNLDVVYGLSVPSSVDGILLAHVPLRPGGSYRFQVAARTTAGISDPAMALFSTAGSALGDSSLTPGVLAGIVLGSFFGMFLLVGLVLFYRRWSARRGYRYM